MNRVLCISLLSASLCLVPAMAAGQIEFRPLLEAAEAQDEAAGPAPEADAYAEPEADERDGAAAAPYASPQPAQAGEVPTEEAPAASSLVEITPDEAAQHDEAPSELDSALPNMDEPAEWDGDEPLLPVLVRVLNDADDTDPVANVDVLVHVLRPPHEIVTTVPGRTDANGELTVEVPLIEGAQIFAQAVHGRSFFSDQPLTFDDTDEEMELVVRIPASTSNAESVVIANMVLVVEPAEEHLVITQLTTLGTEGNRIYRPADGAEPIPLPILDGARNLSIIEPAEGVRSRGDASIGWTGDVAPLGDASATLDRIVVRYHLRTGNASDVDLEMTLPIALRAGMILTPLATPYGRHPRLDIHLDAEACDDPGTADDRVCYTQLLDHDPEGLIRPGIEVRGLRGLRGEAGDQLMVGSSGWPSRKGWDRQLASILALLSLLLGAAFYLHQWRIARGAPPQWHAQRRVEALQAQRSELFAQAASLETAWAEGRVLEEDYRIAHEQIREELGVIYRRLREQEAAAPESG